MLDTVPSMDASKRQSNRASITCICCPSQFTKKCSCLFGVITPTQTRERWSQPQRTKVNCRYFSINHLVQQLPKKKGSLDIQQKELTILAVKTSFPRRANSPRPSAEARHCEGQISPSANILQHKIIPIRYFIVEESNTIPSKRQHTVVVNTWNIACNELNTSSPSTRGRRECKACEVT